MKKLFRYLSESKLMILCIVLLLVVQAYCDLSLPSYTSDIVDVGIQQGGIENTAPDMMREETMDKLSLFLTKEEEEAFRAAYDKNEEGNLELNEKGEEEIDQLNEMLGIPMLMLSSAKESGKADVNQMKQALEAGQMTKEQILQMKDQALEQFGDYSDSMIAAVFAGMLASYTAAKIGMTLRGRVFKKVVSFSNAEMDQYSTASLITRSTNDVQQIQMVSVMLLRMVLYAPILGIGGIIKVATTKTGMGWIIGVGVGAIILLVGVLFTVAMPKFKKMQILVDKLNLVSREILTGIPVIRAFSREKYEEKRFAKANMELKST